MSEKIIFFILSIPLFAAFIWAFLDPRESMLFGKRWMYNEEPEPSEDAIIFTQFTAVIGFIFYSIIFLVVMFG